METLIIFFVCVFSGILTGVLGIGGGLFILPIFLFLSPILHFNLSLQQIIGISTTCVLLNSATGFFYRRKENFENKQTLFKYTLCIISGTIFGSITSSYAPKNIILGIYIFVALLSLYKMMFEISIKIKRHNLLVYILFFIIGAVSASIGTGGAVMFAPLLNYSTGKNVKDLLPTITFLVFTNALFTFLTKLSLGFISFSIIPVALIASLIGTKSGIIISQKLNAKAIHILLATVLFLSLIRVCVELFT